jgi:hypothetical protein
LEDAPVSAAQALRAARDAGVVVGVDGDDLILEASAPPPAAILDLLSRNKAEVLAVLRATVRDVLVTPTTPPREAWSDREQEQAAVAEFDGGVPRAWAEGLARLDPDKPPGDVPPRRWLCFIDDCGRFLDGGWASRAAELGWGPLDLFGCDRERPFARIEHASLLWLLNGRKLIALTADMAVIETLTGGRQTYHVDLSKSDVSGWRGN